MANSVGSGVFQRNIRKGINYPGTGMNPDTLTGNLRQYLFSVRRSMILLQRIGFVRGSSRKVDTLTRTIINTSSPVRGSEKQGVPGGWPSYEKTTNN